MIFDRLTWIGLMIAAAGWPMLFSSPQLNDVMLRFSGRTIESGGLNFALVAQSLMACGFGVTIIGVLQSGFGVLNRFFETVAARVRPAADASAASAAPTSRVRSLETSPIGDAAPARASATPRRPARKIVERGWVKERAYVQLSDGTVEVETILGRRQFGSLKEAHEFIS